MGCAGNPFRQKAPKKPPERGAVSGPCPGTGLSGGSPDSCPGGRRSIVQGGMFNVGHGYGSQMNDNGLIAEPSPPGWLGSGVD